MMSLMPDALWVTELFSESSHISNFCMTASSSKLVYNVFSIFAKNSLELIPLKSETLLTSIAF